MSGAPLNLQLASNAPPPLTLQPPPRTVGGSTGIPVSGSMEVVDGGSFGRGAGIPATQTDTMPPPPIRSVCVPASKRRRKDTGQAGSSADAALEGTGASDDGTGASDGADGADGEGENEGGSESGEASVGSRAGGKSASSPRGESASPGLPGENKNATAGEDGASAAADAEDISGLSEEDQERRRRKKRKEEKAKRKEHKETKQEREDRLREKSKKRALEARSGSNDGSRKKGTEMTREEQLEWSRIQSRDHSRRSRQRRKQLEESLKEENKQMQSFQTLVEESSHLISICSPDMYVERILNLNRFQKFISSNYRLLHACGHSHVRMPSQLHQGTAALCSPTQHFFGC